MKNIIDFSGKQRTTKEAASWLLKLESDGGLSTSEKHEINLWLEQDPSNFEELKRLADVWNSANVLTELAVPIPQPVSFKKILFTRSYSRKYVALAASLFVAIAIASFFYFDRYSPVQQNGVIVTKIGTQKP